MNSIATIVLILLVVIVAFAVVRTMSGTGGAAGPGARPMPPTDRVVEREVERPPAQERVVEREVIERDVPPDRI